ncbi:hypothetical protein F4815DRAFT_443081 [Daldinia loculata]|nr:hypothetical protein F4815DRAFT_443081 [Daldinia loculata]
MKQAIVAVLFAALATAAPLAPQQPGSLDAVQRRQSVTPEFGCDEVVTGDEQVTPELDADLRPKSKYIRETESGFKLAH